MSAASEERDDFFEDLRLEDPAFAPNGPGMVFGTGTRPPTPEQVACHHVWFGGNDRLGLDYGPLYPFRCTRCGAVTHDRKTDVVCSWCSEIASRAS